MGNPSNSIDPRSLRQAWVRAITSVVPTEPQILEPLLCSLLGGTHLVIEGPAHKHRTLLVRALARCLDGSFHTIRCSEETAPSEILGTAVWRPGPPKPTIVPGPIFGNLILLENLHLASEAVLKSLDQALATNRVVIEGQDMELKTPFHAIATSNPLEADMANPTLRKALDHFAVCARVHPSNNGRTAPAPLATDPEALLSELQPLLTIDQLLAAQQCVQKVEVGEEAVEHVLRIVIATREHDDVATGVNTKATLSWLQTAKARAWLEGRDHIAIDDLKALAVPSLAHRVLPRNDQVGPDFVDDLLSTLVTS